MDAKDVESKRQKIKDLVLSFQDPRNRHERSVLVCLKIKICVFLLLKRSVVTWLHTGDAKVAGFFLILLLILFK